MLYPLIFKPQLKERIWGGVRLAEKLGKGFPTSGVKYGESWELSGVEGSLSEVANGFLAGNTIQELIEVYMGDLVGEQVYEKFGDEFPLLIKLIDTNDYLSVQVHPDDEMAKKLHHAFGKSEMWYIIDSEDKSEIITGFNKPFSRELYIEALSSGSLAQHLKTEKAITDDFFYIPARRVHALGKGLLLAEIQQTSDVTYRIFDWNRVDSSGKARELHTDLALEAIDFDADPLERRSSVIEANKPQELVKSPFFMVNRLVLTGDFERETIQIDSFIVYMCLNGTLDIYSDGNEPVTVKQGEVVLVPATLSGVILRPRSVAKLLEVYLD